MPPRPARSKVAVCSAECRMWGGESWVQGGRGSRQRRDGAQGEGRPPAADKPQHRRPAAVATEPRGPAVVGGMRRARGRRGAAQPTSRTYPSYHGRGLCGVGLGSALVERGGNWEVEGPKQAEDILREVRQAKGRRRERVEGWGAKRGAREPSSSASATAAAAAAAAAGAAMAAAAGASLAAAPAPAAAAAAVAGAAAARQRPAAAAPPWAAAAAARPRPARGAAAARTAAASWAAAGSARASCGWGCRG
jgi:hypothetical protein